MSHQSELNVTSDEYRAELLTAIKSGMNALEAEAKGHYEDSEVPERRGPGVPDGVQPSINFDEVLGTAKDDKNWWLLYIDPKDWDWAKATAKTTNDPGMVYDNHLSLGFKAAMVRAFTRHLINAPLGKRIMEGPFGWRDYEGLWRDVVEGVTDKESGKPQGMPTQGSAGQGAVYICGTVVTFGCTETMDAGVAEETLAGNVLVRSVSHLEGKIENDRWVIKETQKKGAVALHPSSPGYKMWTCLDVEAKKTAVDRAFLDFKNDVGKGTTIKACLMTIAKLIRRLHIIHTYSDGNGRLNVFLLLPALLLHFGFGLPLGGAHKDVFNGPTLRGGGLFMLFNGGYSLEDISDYLFLSQDKGFKDLKNSVLAAAASASGHAH